MAKPFYTAKEAGEKLGVTEDKLRAMASEGKVREFRDGGQFVYKTEDVDELMLSGGDDSGADELVLEPAGDTGDAAGLSGSGSGLEVLLSEDSLLGELGASQSGTAMPLAEASSDLSGTDIPAMPEEIGADAGGSSGGDLLDDLALGGSDTSEVLLEGSDTSEILLGGSDTSEVLLGGSGTSEVLLGGTGTSEISLGDLADDSLSEMSGTGIPFKLAEDSLLGGTASGASGAGTSELMTPASGLESSDSKEGSGEASATELSLNLGDDSLLGGTGTETPLSLGEDSLLGGLGGSGTEVPLDLAGDSGTPGGSGGGSDLGTGTDVFSLEEDVEPDKDVAAAKEKDGTVITSVGVNVFDEDEADEADPLAGTAETDLADELGLDSIGSGSGLLDLTRESDDTSLGVDLAGELYSDGDEEGEDGLGGGEEEEDKDETSLGLEEIGDDEAPVEEVAAQPAAVATAAAVSFQQVGLDPLSGMLNGLLLVGILVMIIGGMVGASVIQGVWPTPLELLYQNFVYFVGGAFGLTVIVGLVGFTLGRR